ncbi:MAG: ORF6N domain-containing protein [Firmicutes bacterium]|nr:ORF6N domain-containing protein [Bacillota bacterium]
MLAVRINDDVIDIKEYNGQRVITFADIDRVHKRPEGTAGRNFRENRNRFIQNEDFFCIKLTNDEIRRQFGTGKNASEVILITESGYLMLAKSLTDDLAWQVQRQLVKVYFRAKELNSRQHELKELVDSVRELERNFAFIVQKISAMVDSSVTGTKVIYLPKRTNHFKAGNEAMEVFFDMVRQNTGQKISVIIRNWKQIAAANGWQIPHDSSLYRALKWARNDQKLLAD